MFPRRFTIRLTFVTAVLVAGTSSACNDLTLMSAPQGPATSRLEKPHETPHIAGANVPIVRRTTPLRVDESACARITPDDHSESVSLKLNKAGLKVTFPRGSVSSAINVCLVAHAGPLLTYSFYPHGLQFNTDITVRQSLRGTTAFHNSTLASDLIGGYLANGVENDVDTKGVGNFAQTFNVLGADEVGTVTNVTPSTVSFYTNHFSGYALASGKVVGP